MSGDVFARIILEVSTKDQQRVDLRRRLQSLRVTEAISGGREVEEDSAGAEELVLHQFDTPILGPTFLGLIGGNRTRK